MGVRFRRDLPVAGLLAWGAAAVGDTNVFLDSFTFDGTPGATAPVSSNLAVRQAGGAVTSGYTTAVSGVSTNSVLLVDGHAGLASDALQFRTYLASSSSQGAADLVTNLAPHVAGRVWSVSGRLQIGRSVTNISDAWLAVSLGDTGGLTGPNHATTDFALLVRGSGGWQIWEDNMAPGSGAAGVLRSPDLWSQPAAFRILVDESEPPSEASVIVMVGATTNTLGSYTVDFETAVSRHIELRAHQGGGTAAPGALMEAAVDDLAVSLPGDTNGPPVFLTQPASAVTGYGVPVGMAVQAAAQPLSYQWMKDGVPLAGATNRRMRLGFPVFGDAGQYRVRVSNAFGSITSAVATLSVTNPAPRPIETLVGTGLDEDGHPLPPGLVDPHWELLASADPGAPGPQVYSPTNVAGTWLANGTGSCWVAPARSISLLPGPYTYRHAFLLTSGVPETASVTLRWAADNSGTAVRLNGQALPVPLAAGFGGLTAASSFGGLVAGINALEFDITNAGTAANGTGVRVELAGTAMPVPPPGTPPELLLHPTGRVVAAGGPLALAALGYGSGPLTYQWRRDGQAVVGATNAAFSIASASPGDSGLYDVVVTGPAGSATSAVVVVAVAHFTGPTSRRTPLVISEILYHPAPRADGRNLEFVEIFNSNPFPEDLGGFRLSGDVDYVFPPGTRIAAGGHVVVAAAPADVEAVHGLTGVFGPFANPGGLPNGAGTIRLRNRLDAVLLEVDYRDSDPWPPAADGAGHSLVVCRPSYGEGDPRAWAPSAFIGGSPGATDPRALEPDPTGAVDRVTINEIVAHTDPPLDDSVELFNPSASAVDLSGFWLSDDPGTNKFRIPDGTILPARGWLAFDGPRLGFDFRATGDEVLLVHSNGTRVIDAVRFEGQANGVAFGRFPDGTPGLCALDAITPGGANASPLAVPVVIHEIMYHPISGDGADEYVELHNRSGGPVDLGGWAFTDGIAFTFPTGTVLAAGGHLVVARDRDRLLAAHPGAPPAQVLGDFSGALDDGGERIALSRPDTIVSTNSGFAVTSVFHIVENAVTYVDGGRWGRWSDGGGSSLELVDPRADNRLAANWADSDESGKSAWMLIQNTGPLDWGHHAVTNIDQLYLLLLAPGEVLVDDVEVVPQGGSNLLPNPGFEGGTNGWYFHGSHRRSRIEPTNGYGGAAVLRVSAEARGDVVNRVRAPLSSVLASNSTATLSARVRWLRGNPEFLLRLGGGSLEAFGALPVPAGLGTPAAPNSRGRANAGPAIREVAHAPVLPAAGEAVTVTARIGDPDGVAAVSLNYRVDPAAALTAVAMNDDGLDGDERPGDGLYSARLPAQAAGTLVAFHVAAADAAPAAAGAAFPGDAPARECLVRFGETNLALLGNVRIWLTQSNFTAWASREKSSNDDVDSTLVIGRERVIHNVGVHYGSSENYSTSLNNPTGRLVGVNFNIPDDEPFLGAVDVRFDWPVRDTTFTREHLMYWFCDRLGLPWNQRRYVHFFINGVRRGSVFEDAQRPNGDTLEQWFDGDSDGDLLKTNPWFEATPEGGIINRAISPRLIHYLTSGGVSKVAPHRYTFQPRAVRGSAGDYSALFALIDTVNATGDYERTVLSMVDVRQWMRTFAMNDLASYWDGFGNPNDKNSYLYKPGRDGWKIMSWDFDVGLGVFNDPTNAVLLSTDVDPALWRMDTTPAFVRHYWAALDEALATFFDAAPGTEIDRFLRERHVGLVSAGVNPASPFAPGGAYDLSIPGWIAGRRAFIEPQVSTMRSTFMLTNAPIATVETNRFVLGGTAPLGAVGIRVNGQAVEAAWATVSHWTAAVTLSTGTNVLAVTLHDALGGPMTGAVAAAVFTGVNAWPPLRINEWMAGNSGIVADPADGDADDWFEIHNPTAAAVSLDGWSLADQPTNVVRFPVPAGYAVPAVGRLVVWADKETWQNSTNRPDLHVDFQLAKSGEWLLLYAPDGTLVDSVEFGPQIDNVSMGRWRDGMPYVYSLEVPTPGAPNRYVPPPPLVTGVGVAGDAAVVNLAVTPGITGRLEYVDHLADTNWVPVEPPVPADGTFLSMTNLPSGVPCRFYRVRSTY